MKKNIGICLGSSTVKLTNLTDGEVRVFSKKYEGNLSSAIEELIKEAGITGEEVSVVITGRKNRKNEYFRSVSEPEAVQKALLKLGAIFGASLPEAIVSFGGQTIIAYQLDKRGRIIDAHTFNKCGSGTGDFFLQQIKRLGFATVKEAVEAALSEEALAKPYVPAARCSVFCKSDCTHATNERKATKPAIVAGLCKMIAAKISELLKKIGAKRIWLVGGGSKIEPVVSYLKGFGLDVYLPPFAEAFEALGAGFLAVENKAAPIALKKEMFQQDGTSFSSLPLLETFTHSILWKKMPHKRAQAGDQCLLGIDVGSTTRKAVLVRLNDLCLVGSSYGYTLGNPHLAVVEALKQLKDISEQVKIAGIVVTGSGRRLIELFLSNHQRQENNPLLEQAIAINEITCHARAAEYFNPGVKTVLEIGGQDAKYTFLENGVPVDFAMNEACSAGTGSFLAEVVDEMFGIKDPRAIAPLALKSFAPLGFGDQCAAFIESDINSALGEGASREDVMAGLCYSICLNYINRVVGNRPIKAPISVQGGTAYNKAFCLAMAGVMEKNSILPAGEKIVVNEDAGLMGAIGAAFCLNEKIKSGEYQPFSATLDDLLAKRIEEGKTFTCSGKGGGQECDLKCEIKNFKVNGVNVPFGGSCRRYESIRKGEKVFDPAEFDLTMRRDQLLFKTLREADEVRKGKRVVGMLGNLFDLNLMPFFAKFFQELGLKIVLAEKDETLYEDGVKKQGAAFCYPVERSFGLLANLTGKRVDYYWLPHIKGLDTGEMEGMPNQCCPLSQASPYYLKAAFSEIPEEKILAPFLDFSAGSLNVLESLLSLKDKLGASQTRVIDAFWSATLKQEEFERAKRAEGAKMLNALKDNPNKIAIVVFGRPYNAFSGHLKANRGITRKLASFGIPVVPLDFLPLAEMDFEKKMYWPAGQLIARGARFVAAHQQLFAVYLTNFSCGPDSFLNFLFREVLGSKPSLTLEFDEHTANAGFDTRIEAFLDIVDGYRKTARETATQEKEFKLAKVVLAGELGWYLDSRRNKAPLSGQSVKLVYPDMGEFGTEALAAVTKSLGIRSKALAPADETCLQIGRRYSSCKECLPYNLTLGSLIRYLEKREAGERTIFFMPDTTGPCRFGMYNQFMRRYLVKHQIPDVALISLSAENKYAGLGPKFSERAWIAINTAEAFENMAAALHTLAQDKEAANTLLLNYWGGILGVLEQGVGFGNFRWYKKLLKEASHNLGAISLKKTLEEAPKVLITGEIYMRKAKFATEAVRERLVEEGFVVLRSPVIEWIEYNDYLMKKGINPKRKESWLRKFFEKRYKKFIFQILSGSGLLLNHLPDIAEIIKTAEGHISLRLQGEAILTIGAALKEVFSPFAGIVVLGPFGCMPTRVAASILAYKMTAKEKLKLDSSQKVRKLVGEFPVCPMLVYEADGANPPPIMQAKLDVFCLVAKNVGEKMADFKGSKSH